MSNKLYEFLKSGQYLPKPLRDFHNQKDVFKAVWVQFERQQAKQEFQGDSYMFNRGLSWINLQILTIDHFLWFMARHGYTLQRTRKAQELECDDLYETTIGKHPGY